MSEFTDDDLLQNSTRLMSTKVCLNSVHSLLRRLSISLFKQIYHAHIYVQIGRSRDPQRFAKQKVEEELKLAPFEGPEIVTHQSDTSEQNKSGQNGEKKHRGCSRNALGGFFSS